ncbi:MAG: methionine--tRNA ligase subunit beta [bacterium]
MEEEKSKLISIDEFKQVELRVAKVLKAERVENTDKLLRLEVDLGEEQRQIVAGIAEYYAPESLLDKNIVVVVNLQPAKIRGLESNGMLLAAEDESGDLALVTLDKEIAAGSKIS